MGISTNVSNAVRVEDQQMTFEEPTAEERGAIGNSHTSLSPTSQREKEIKIIREIMKKQYGLEQADKLQAFEKETLLDKNERVIGRYYVFTMNNREFDVTFSFENGQLNKPEIKEVF
ncbi:MAG: hypothetical protein AAF443_07400 [Chlamydiota bacterium]